MQENVDALDSTLEALEGLGRLEDVDGALVQAARSLAAAVDADSSNASLWREYRAVLDALRKVGDSDDGGFEAAIAGLRSKVRDSAKS